MNLFFHPNRKKRQLFLDLLDIPAYLVDHKNDVFFLDTFSSKCRALYGLSSDMEGVHVDIDSVAQITHENRHAQQYLERILRILRQCISTNKSQAIELHMHTRVKSLWSRNSYVPLIDQDGQQKILVTVIDLSDQMTAIRSNEAHFAGLLSQHLDLCTSCSAQVLSDEKKWVRVEEYSQQLNDIEFSHGICPSCAEEVLSDA